jgi:hypothetical protein
MESFLIDTGLYISYILIGIAVIAAITFPIIFIIHSPKKAKATLFGILGLSIIFVISFSLSSNEMVRDSHNPLISKLVGGGLIMFYILFVAAILVAIYSEIARIFK